MYKLNLDDEAWALQLNEFLSGIQYLIINALEKDWLDSNWKA